MSIKRIIEEAKRVPLPSAEPVVKAAREKGLAAAEGRDVAKITPKLPEEE